MGIFEYIRTDTTDANGPLTEEEFFAAAAAIFKRPPPLVIPEPRPRDGSEDRFGDRCDFCRREIPCECAGAPCMCTCGRCQYPGPLPDDGPL